MILKKTLAEVAKAQRKNLKDTGIEREMLKKISLNQQMIQVISGIRRSGKSTLMKQLMKDLINVIGL